MPSGAKRGPRSKLYIHKSNLQNLHIKLHMSLEQIAQTPQPSILSPKLLNLKLSQPEEHERRKHRWWHGLGLLKPQMFTSLAASGLSGTTIKSNDEGSGSRACS